MDATRFDRLGRALLAAAPAALHCAPLGAGWPFPPRVRLIPVPRRPARSPESRPRSSTSRSPPAAPSCPERAPAALSSRYRWRGSPPHRLVLGPSDRLAGTVRIADFVAAPVFDLVDPPNAALVAETVAGEAVVVVELTSPATTRRRGQRSTEQPAGRGAGWGAGSAGWAADGAGCP